MRWMSITVLILQILFSSILCFGDTTPPSYVVRRSPEQITVDGRLDEGIWNQVPRMEFLDIARGIQPPWPGHAVMLWDDDFLYVGFYIENPDIWATLAQDAPEPRSWLEHQDRFVMHNDPFAKLFFDPDGDGYTYAELHINANNNVDDWYFVNPCHWINGKDEFYKPENMHLELDYEGLKSAVHVEGTLNNHQDIDRYWTLEVAFPWESLREITRGPLPPSPGTVWRAHLGSVLSNVPKAQHRYYTWPVIGLIDCHRLHRWGFIVFANEYKEFSYE